MNTHRAGLQPAHGQGTSLSPAHLPLGTVPSQCWASVLWHGHRNGEGHPHVGVCWHTKKSQRNLSLPKRTRPQPAPAPRGNEGSPWGCRGGTDLHWALPAQCPGVWHRLKQGPVPGWPRVPRTQQEPCPPQQPKPLPSDLIPTRLHDVSILPAQDGSLSQRRATPPLRPPQ